MHQLYFQKDTLLLVVDGIPHDLPNTRLEFMGRFPKAPETRRESGWYELQTSLSECVWLIAVFRTSTDSLESNAYAGTCDGAPEETCTVSSRMLHGAGVTCSQVPQASRGDSRTGNGSGIGDPNDHLVWGAVGPIACLTHAGVALRCAVQEVDPRFDRPAAPASANHVARQAAWEWKPELPRPQRPREEERASQFLDSG
jgi:hypothetical protein